MKSFKISNDTDDYILKPIEIYHSNHTTKFGIKISFERNPSGITEILMNYHLMCSMLVLTSSINFLIDPKCVPGRVGLLVTLFLVLTSFFSAAQVCTYLIDRYTFSSNYIIHKSRVSIVEFIVGNTVEVVNVTMNPTNSDKASEKKVLVPYQELNLRPPELKESILTIRPRLIVVSYSQKF